MLCAYAFVLLFENLIITIFAKCFQAKLLAAQKELGREFRVFTSTIGTAKPEEVSGTSTGFHSLF